MARQAFNLGLSPVKPRQRFTKRDPRELNLTEIAIIRRLSKRERPVDIARTLGVHESYPRAVRTRLRNAFGCSTNEELYAHPDIIRQIKED